MEYFPVFVSMFHSTLLKRHGNRKAYFIFYLEFNVEESFNLKLLELLYCKPRWDFLIIRTWVTSEIPDLGPEQSLFITTNTKVSVRDISCKMRSFLLPVRTRHLSCSTSVSTSAWVSVAWAVLWRPTSGRRPGWFPWKLPRFTSMTPANPARSLCLQMVARLRKVSCNTDFLLDSQWTQFFAGCRK